MPSEREPLIDVVRALAIVGVVAGHWLVTAVVVGGGGVLGELSVDSALRHLPSFTPLSWVLQTLGLFFFAGGFAGAVSQRRAVAQGERLVRWWWVRFRRLALAIAVVLAAWSVALAVLAAVGLRWAAADTMVTLVTSPLWFLAAYLGLLAVTAPMRALHGRFGVAAVVVPAALAVVVELAVAVGAPRGVGYLTLLFVWWVPWQLGVAMADGWRPRWGAAIAVGAALAMAGLVVFAGYPASAVGGTAQRSNLNPPSLVALSLAVAQVGLVLAVASALRAVARWRGWRAAVAWVNDRALPIFLLHQSALVAVVLVAGAFAPVAGLHGVPGDAWWVLARLAWFLVFAVVLVALLAALRSVIRPRRGRSS